MRRKNLSSAGLTLAVLFLLPLRTDGGQTECCNLTSSLASTIDNPVNGDEQFFNLPVGPANVMLLVDTSGSMVNLPQCGDMGGNWGSWNVAGQPSCIWPTLPALPTSKTAASVGSCDMTGNTQLAWMNGVAPTSNLPDPGRTNSLLTDNPTWGSTCTGNGCMFSPTAFYGYGDWTETTATQRPACTALSGGGSPIVDANGVQVTADPTACNACMTSSGFYFFQVRYLSKSPSTYANTPVQLRFAGTWLNANPPKFMTARKVVKDLAFMDPNNPSNLDQVRFGLSILPTSNAAIIVVPLGPDCATSFPPTQANFAQARQYILNAVNKMPSSLYSAISGGTPLATTLFRIGQYFTTPGVYTTAFGASYELAQFKESVPGLVNAPWAQSNPNQHSICWGCQQSSIVIVTDGSPNSEMTFPTGICTSGASPTCSLGYDQTTFTNAANCGANGSNCIDPVDGRIAVVPRVASWLHNNDLRTDLSVSDPQTVQTYAVSFNVPVQAAQNILNASANMGAGSFNNASNGQALASAVFSAVNAVVARANTFGAPATSSFSTIQSVANGAYLARFKPNNTSTWEGHVYQGMIFDEFANGCDPTVGLGAQAQVACGPKMVFPNFNGNVDVNGNNICTDVFLVDADCDEVTEDPKTGAFVKKGLGNTPANMFWDAGLALSSPVYLAPDPRAGQPVPGYKSANARNILTAVSGSMVPFTTANAATLAPLMNLDPTWCTTQLQAWKICGPSPLPACTNVTTQCAQSVINFVRGWDVTDNDLDGCGGPGRQGNSTNCPGGADGEERNRPNDARTANPVFWKLGDIFHSSPVLVKPPADEFTCDTGYENQCWGSIHSPSSVLPSQTSIESDYAGLNGKLVDAYEAYRLAQVDRQQLLLVGSNDGMLHAFDAGVPDTSKTRNALGQLPYTRGTGTELWAFIPPDMLPRLKDLTQTHQYMVDGSTMVRDVWVDGSNPTNTTLAPPDNRKQIGEFHTVAILTERAGGTQLVALDVTNPLSPQFLWTFPPPCSDDSRFMGQSWVDFAPGPPPIGPVKLALRSGEPDPTNRGFEERWVVFVNGGYDPALDLGRAVWMVDVWTGQAVWRFTDDDFKAQMAYGSGVSMFPIPGGINAVDIGDPTQPKLDQDGFLDTATWGDMGGNVFLARFQSPGTPDPSTGRVTNWFAARTFEERRNADDSQSMIGRSEFYYRPENTYDPVTKTVRTFIGSGNRERIMQIGAACSPDNLLGCCQAGCTLVSATTTDNYGACSTSNSFSCANGVLTRSPGTSNCGATASCAAAPGNAFTSTVQLSFQCTGAPNSTVTGQISCNAAGTCGPVTSVGSSAVNGTFPSQTMKSRFYGIWAYGGDPKKMFNDLASAQAFEKNRFTDVPFSGCSGPSGGSCQLVDTTFANVSYSVSPLMASTTCGGGKTVCSATGSDPGWYYEYGDNCPLQSCNPSPPWTDEKTGASPTLILGCTSWGSFRPIGASSGTNPCTGNVGTPVTYSYTANYLTGTPSGTCGTAYNGTIYIASPRSTIAPPSSQSPEIVVNAQGQVQYKGLEMPPGGSGAEVMSTTFGTRTQIAEPAYWLEVPRDLHTCRHVDATTCE